MSWSRDQRLAELVGQSKQFTTMFSLFTVLLGASDMGEVFMPKRLVSQKNTQKVEPYRLVPATFNATFSTGHFFYFAVFSKDLVCI